MLVRVTDFQDRGAAGVLARPVFINPAYIVAMEPYGTKYTVFVGRSLEYVVSTEDAERLGQCERPLDDGPGLGNVGEAREQAYDSAP